jgi:hydrogenase-4 component F
MLLVLVLLPLVLAGVAFLVRANPLRAWLLPVGAAAHLGITALVLFGHPPLGPGAYLGLDPLNRVVLGFISVLFFLCSVYAKGYLALRPEQPARLFTASLLAFLGMLSLSVLAQHLGLMWVAVEACTLSSAPLVYFNQNRRSLEATWKYLLIGSVGIALALLGSYFLSYSALKGGMSTSLFFTDLVREAPYLSHPWLRAAFVVLFVGYGTKMGLAPMHSWKPDAYGEAPGLVGALLAGGLTTIAFLAVLRFFQICNAAGDAVYARQIMIAIGLLSMAVAAVFMVRQRDYKRMLAYSSVEHMGILVLGVSLGGLGLYGALLHALNNGLTKGVLFLAAGNLHRAYGSKRVEEVSGALRRLPATGALFLAGFFAITGSPPFGLFISEFTILRAALAGGHVAVAVAFLALLFIIFVGMSATVLSIVQGEPSEKARASRHREGFATVAPIAACLGLVLVLGLYVPPSLSTALTKAVAFIEMRP